MSRLPFLYAKMDVNYADHPKIAGLSDAAFRAHVEMILYSRKYLTDGRIAKRIAKRFGTDSLGELLANDDANPSLTIESNGDYLLHGFTSMQGTREEIEEKSQVNATNGRLGGIAKAKRIAKRTASETVSQSESESESEITTPVVKSRRPTSTSATRGTRLPADWTPNPRLIEFVQTECPSVDGRTETDQFRDYWHSKVGRDSTKADWDATYRKWMRTAQERAPSTRKQSAGRVTTDQRFIATLDLSQRLAQQEAANVRQIGAGS